MKKKEARKPLTTKGWIKLQANKITTQIDKAIAENNFSPNYFGLIIQASIIHNLCEICIFSGDVNQGKVRNLTVVFDEPYNPFYKKSYWEIVEKELIGRYNFKTVKKTANVERYEFRH